MKAVLRKLLASIRRGSHALAWVQARVLLTVLYIVLFPCLAASVWIRRAFSRRRAPQWVLRPRPQETAVTLERMF